MLLPFFYIYEVFFSVVQKDCKTIKLDVYRALNKLEQRRIQIQCVAV